MEGYCIMCGDRKQGIGIREDRVIGAIRWFKKNVTKNEKGHKLVVCKACYPDYKKRYDKYTKRRAIYLILGILFLVFEVAVSFSLLSLLLGLLVLAVLYAFSLLSYTPGLSLPAEQKKAQRKG